MDYSTSAHDLAGALERLDHPGRHSEEAIRTALLRGCLEDISGLSQALLGVTVDGWRSGGRFQGDLVGMQAGRLIVHLEIKGPDTQPNWSGACNRANCAGPNVQFEHMLEDGVLVTLLTSPGARSLRELRRRNPVLLERLRVMHWEEVAAAIRSLPPADVDLIKAIRSMLGV